LEHRGVDLIEALKNESPNLSTIDYARKYTEVNGYLRVYYFILLSVLVMGSGASSGDKYLLESTGTSATLRSCSSENLPNTNLKWDKYLRLLETDEFNESAYKISAVNLGIGSSGQVSRVTRFDNANFALKVICPQVKVPSKISIHARIKTLVFRSMSSAKKYRHAQEQQQKQEVSILRNCNHPYIIRLIEVNRCSDTNFRVVLELCSGGDLYQRLKETGHFGEADVSRMMRQMLCAVSYLHDKGIVHRDIKLENWMTRAPASLDLVLIDFGLSEQLENTGVPSISGCTGTIAYMAPEVGVKMYGIECDIWSLGVIAYRLLSGYLPFDGDTDAEVFNRVRMMPVTYSSDIWQCHSNACREFISNLLQKNPENRATAIQCMLSPWITRYNEIPEFSHHLTVSILVKGIDGYCGLTSFQRWIVSTAAAEGMFNNSTVVRNAFRYLDSTSTGRFDVDQLMNLFPDSDTSLRLRCRKVFSNLSYCDGFLDWNSLVTLFIAGSPEKLKQAELCIPGLISERLARTTYVKDGQILQQVEQLRKADQLLVL